jgi:hypothetical protein
MNNREKYIIEQVVGQINKTLDWLDSDKKVTYQYNTNDHHIHDGILHFDCKDKAIKEKKYVSMAMLPKLLTMHKQKPFILFTEYLNSHMAEALVESDIEFADLAGNMFLKFPEHTLLLIKNEKPKKLMKKKRVGRAFSPSGLKLLYQLLTVPEALMKNYRELQKMSGVSLGSIGWIINDLKDRGFLVELNGERRFVNKDKIIERWCQAYEEKLKPKLNSQRYSTDIDLMRCAHFLDGLPAAWSGEMAAYILVKSARPVTARIYHWGNINMLKTKARLKPDPDGNIELLDIFWFETDNNISTVHPLLVYADLIAEESSRNIETAIELLNKYPI